VCGSFAAVPALEKSPDDILDITAASILKKAGGLPEEGRGIALFYLRIPFSRPSMII